MKTITKIALLGALAFTPLLHVEAKPEQYKIDTEGAHAFVQFRVKHLGYSWLYGRFNDFDGSFIYDEENPSNNSIEIKVDVTSLDSNHAERDKHLRDDKYLNTSKASTATFKSTKYESTGKDTGKLTGDLTLMGVTKPLVIDVERIGGGADPWGGYRQGFQGSATIMPKDFGMKGKVGEVELILSVEGIRQK